MENFHPLPRMPSHADVPNLVHHCTKFVQHCAKLGAQEIVQNSLCPPQKKYFDLFFSFLENFADLFLATSLILLTFLSCLAIFLTFFWLVSPIMCVKIPLCAQNYVALIRHVLRKPYYAGHSRNSWHNHTTVPDIFGIMCNVSSLDARLGKWARWNALCGVGEESKGNLAGMLV